MKLKILNGDKRNFIQELTKFLNVRKDTQSKNLFMVKRIVNDVRSNGDKAIFKYEKKFTKIKKLNKKFTLSDGEVIKIIKKLNSSHVFYQAFVLFQWLKSPKKSHYHLILYFLMKLLSHFQTLKSSLFFCFS